MANDPNQPLREAFALSYELQQAENELRRLNSEHRLTPGGTPAAIRARISALELQIDDQRRRLSVLTW